MTGEVDDADEIPDDGDPRKPFLKPRTPRYLVPVTKARRITQKARADIDSVGSLADLHRLRHASRDQWRDPEDDAP